LNGEGGNAPSLFIKKREKGRVDCRNNERNREKIEKKEEKI
jgi:hypothetical protein